MKRPEKILKKLLDFDLHDRIKEVEKDVNSKKDEYASINSFDLANALGVPLNAIDGSGHGECHNYCRNY